MLGIYPLPGTRLNALHSDLPMCNKCGILVYILWMRKLRQLYKFFKFSTWQWSQDLEPRQFDYRAPDLESLTKMSNSGFIVIILCFHFIWTVKLCEQ